MTKRELPPLAALIVDLLALAVGIGGFLTLPERLKIPVLLLLAALLAGTAVWMKGRWRYATGALLALALIVGAGAAWLGLLDDRPHHGDATIVRPAVGEEVPPCSRVEVQVRGNQPPDGWAYAVAQRDDQDARYYFEPLRAVGSTWVTEISTFTTPLHLWVIAIDANLARYLATTTDEKSATWWSTPDWPPDSVQVHDQPNPLAGEPSTECPEEAGSETPTPQPEQASILKIDEPLPACSRVEVPIRGQAPPTGWVYAVGHRDRGTPRHYFELVQAVAHDEWVGEVSTGLDEATLWLVALDERWGQYLSDVIPEPEDARWWSSTDMPPGAVIIDQETMPVVGDCG
jgi:hypothetical protein